jgi:prepilin-type N-terminal cleavage/methylation domain-containing protein
MQKFKGFTIVELLIVIVVIGILASLTTASFNGVTNRSKDLYLRTDMRNISQSIEQYRAENGSLPQNSTDLFNYLTAVPNGPFWKIWSVQNPNGVSTVADFSNKIYKIVPNAGNPLGADYNLAVGVERTTDTYVIIANSAFGDVYFMDKSKKMNVGTISWSTTPATLFITNAGLTSPVSYVRFTF